MQTSDVPPSQTVYVQNLNEKIKLEEMKKSLYLVFSQFGEILEVHANKRLATRGQAWVVFSGLQGATQAVRKMQGFDFYGKPMRVAYAKAKSDVVAKADGTFVARPKRVAEDETVAAKRAKKVKAEAAMESEDEDEDEEAPAPSTPAASAAPAVVQEVAPPNRILFVENLAPQITTVMLDTLFRQYEGYNESRLVPAKVGIAFVEFKDAYQAGTAMEGLQSFQLTEEHKMKITYAKQ